MEIKRGKWKWIRHMRREGKGVTEMAAVDRSRSSGRPRTSWKRATEVEGLKKAKHGMKANLFGNMVRWRDFVDALRSCCE